MQVHSVLAFALACAVLVALPGPSVLFTISRALTVGRRAAVATVAGTALGAYIQVIAVAFGVGALVQRSAEVFTVVKFVGAAYIVYLGVQAIRHRRSLAETFKQRIEPVGRLRGAWDGFVVGATNPKSVAFFVIVLPEFTNPAAGSVVAQMLILGALFPAITLPLNSVWAFVAGTAREWFARSPRRLAMIGGTSGLVMIGLGASLAFTGRNS